MGPEEYKGIEVYLEGERLTEVNAFEEIGINIVIDYGRKDEYIFNYKEIEVV